jgi:hypothetical protein
MEPQLYARWIMFNTGAGPLGVNRVSLTVFR